MPCSQSLFRCFITLLLYFSTLMFHEIFSFFVIDKLAQFFNLMKIRLSSKGIHVFLSYKPFSSLWAY